MRDEPTNQKEAAQLPPPTKIQGVGCLPFLSACVGLIIGAIAGGFLAGEMHKMSRGASGDFGEIKIALEMMAFGGVIGVMA
jgi:hypothetical protein